MLIKYTKTYTADTVLAHKGQEVKAQLRFSTATNWSQWREYINGNDSLQYVVSDFILVNEPVGVRILRKH